VIRVTRIRAMFAIAASSLVSLAAFAPAPASASCTKPINPIDCVEEPICKVGYELGFQCVDSVSATSTTERRVCIRPLGYVTPCLETVVCGAPSTIARAAGLDEYGIDPTVNCVH
jgi:hypothetical protein